MLKLPNITFQAVFQYPIIYYPTTPMLLHAIRPKPDIPAAIPSSLTPFHRLRDLKSGVNGGAAGRQDVTLTTSIVSG